MCLYQNRHHDNISIDKEFKHNRIRIVSTLLICLIIDLLTLVGKKCELPGSAGAAGTSSSSPWASSRTSSPSTAVQELLPPSEIRSLSPASLLTNGSTLCAQYRQRTADLTEREDDSVSRSTNVCGPITACGLSQQKKMLEKIGKSGGSTETGHHSS